jgi:hypothetical protein
MTLTTPHHQDVQTDVCKDRRVDGRKDDPPTTNAFVIVLANHLCRIRHKWFCAESLVMPSRVG